MRDVLNSLNQLCSDSQMRDLVTKLQHHLDIVQQSTSRMSSRAEVFGAVQQEERMNHAYEIMVAYVENLKRLYEKEHHELEETRRLLVENHLLPPINSQDSLESGLSNDDPKKGNFRTLPSSASPSGLKPGTRRRASVAVIHRPVMESSKSSLGAIFGGSSSSIGEFRSRVNSAVGSLVHSGSSGRLERLVISGSGPAISAPATAFSGPPGGVLQGFTFPPGPQAVSSSGTAHVGGHLQLSPRNSSDSIIATEISREECQKLESQEAVMSSVDQEPIPEKTPHTEEGNVSKGGYYVGLDRYVLEDEKKGSETVCAFRPGIEHLSTRLSTSSSVSSSSQPCSYSCESSTSFSRGRADISLLKQLLPRKFLRKSCSVLLTWFPDDGWWMQWDVSSTTRALRYSLGTVLFLAALFSLLVTFLPAQDVPYCLFTTSAYPDSQDRCFQEILQVIFGPSVSRRQDTNKSSP